MHYELLEMADERSSLILSGTKVIEIPARAAETKLLVQRQMETATQVDRMGRWKLQP